MEEPKNQAAYEDPYGPIDRKQGGAKATTATTKARTSIRNQQPFAHHHGGQNRGLGENFVAAPKAKAIGQPLPQQQREVDLTFAPLSGDEKRKFGGKQQPAAKRRPPAKP